MADASYHDADVFACQVQAHKTFFEGELPSGFKPLPKKHWPSSMPKDWIGIVYDITGFYGQQVVALLSQIVNDKDQFKKDNTFYLLIRNSSEDKKEFEPLYRLRANPTKDQPGNGIVVLRPKHPKNPQGPEDKPVEFTEPPKKYDELNGALKAHYHTDTKSFAEDIKKLLKGNAHNKGIPEATIEAYMILLFEIARRLVKIENPSEKKEAFDVLPIGSAIARLIKLLELGISSLEDVFFPKKRFHCFTGKPEDRRKAIEEINGETPNTKPPTTEAEEIETNPQLQELRELFCPDSQPAETYSVEELENNFKNLNTGISQEKSTQSSQTQPTSSAESTAAFDHLE